jgi:hypothetical protein
MAQLLRNMKTKHMLKTYQNEHLIKKGEEQWLFY